MRAEDTSKLFLDNIVDEVYPYDKGYMMSDERFGAMLYKDSLFKRINGRYIVSMFGKTMYQDDRCYEAIKKVVGYKVGYLCKVLKGDKEKEGAEVLQKYLLSKLK